MELPHNIERKIIMANLNITLNIEELTEAIIQSDMNAVMKSMAVTIFNAYMKAEQTQFIEAENYERTHVRRDYRNGSYERDFTTKIGTLTLSVPRTRSGEFSTELFEKYQRMDKAVVSTLIEMYVSGVSTRKITNIVETLVGKKVSKSFISDVNKNLDPEIWEFQGRSLTHSTFRYIFVDAMYIKVREHHRVVSKAVYIAVGVNEYNRRELIGFKISDEESKQNWTDFFLDLKARGLTQPKMIISDAHAGLKKAIKEVFLSTIWQRCTFHFIRNIIGVMPRKGSKAERDKVAEILRAPSQMRARELKAEFEAMVAENPKYDKAKAILDAGFEDAIQYMLEPSDYHVSLRTTNNLERLNREIRRRERVVGIFPNMEAAVRLIGAVLLDMHTEWEESVRTFFRITNKENE